MPGMTHRARYQALASGYKGRFTRTRWSLAWIVLLIEAHSAWRTQGLIVGTEGALCLVGKGLTALRDVVAPV